MPHLDSARVPTTVIFASLLMLILVSASRTTYTLSAPHAPVTAQRGYGLAAAGQRPVTLSPGDTPGGTYETAQDIAPGAGPDRACRWPRRPAWARHWNSPHAPDGADGNAFD